MIKALKQFWADFWHGFSHAVAPDRKFRWDVSVVAGVLRVSLIAPDGSAITESATVHASTDIPRATRVAMESIIGRVLTQYGPAVDRELIR